MVLIIDLIFDLATIPEVKYWMEAVKVRNPQCSERVGSLIPSFPCT